MHYFYLHHPPMPKHFDPCDVEWVLSLLASWTCALINLKSALKTATLLVLVMTKHSDLILLCINNQCLFLQCYTAIFSCIWWYYG